MGIIDIHYRTNNLKGIQRRSTVKQQEAEKTTAKKLNNGKC